MPGTNELKFSDSLTELERKEAYEHGRTLERLRAARIALEKIAFGRKVSNVTAARAVARLGLEMSNPKGDSRA